MSSAQERAEKVSQELDVLVAKAGLTETLARAEEGPMFPYGALGDDDPALDGKQNSTLYFDERFDYRRRKVRDAIFKVEDLRLRKDIISKYLQMENAALGIDRERVAEAERDFRKAEAEAQELPWISAGITAACWVALGYWLFEIVGAIGGALIGFFGSQGMIDRARKNNAESIKIAEADLMDVKKDVAEDRTRPFTFSVNEEITGERERSEDFKSTFGDRLREYELQKQRGGINSSGPR